MKSFKGICSVFIALALVFGVLMSCSVYAEGEEGGGTSETDPNEGGSNEGGSEEGGSNEGGSNESGAEESGSNEDSSEEGGDNEAGSGEQNENSGGAGEWNGEIVDPTPNTSAPNSNNVPASSVPTYVYVTTGTSTGNVPSRVVVDSETETVEPETIEVETEIESETEPGVKIIERKIVYPVITDMPEVMVPETASPSNTGKIALLATLATGVVVAVLVFFWCIVKLVKIRRFEKIYKEAISKSAVIKKAKITRAG